MAYTKQTWDTTSYVNPTRMNHIEQGIKDLSDNYNKVSQTPTTTENLAYRMLASNSANDSEETDIVRKTGVTYNPSRAYMVVNKQHSETSNQNTGIEIGNNKTNGTEGNNTGVMRLYGKGTYYGQFYDSNDSLTANRTYELPNKNGVLALTNVTLLFNQDNFSTTATSYACDWAKYNMLNITLGTYNNVSSQITVPTSYFDTTGTGTRVLIYIVPTPTSNPPYYEIYKNGNENIYIVGHNVNSIHRIKIYGYL